MARGPAILRPPEGLNKGVFTAGKLDAGPDNFPEISSSILRRKKEDKLLVLHASRAFNQRWPEYPLAALMIDDETLFADFPPVRNGHGSAEG